MANGPKPGTGRVEIYHDGQWGTICHNRWDIENAEVACRMLNFTGALVVPYGPIFDVGNGRIWLDNVDCIGNESSLWECRNDGWDVHNCRHDEDANVMCRTDEIPKYGEFLK